MNPLSRLAGATIALLVTAVAASGTAYAKLPEPDPEPVPPVAYEAPSPTVVIEGMPVLQVIALMLLAAIAAAVVTRIAGRHLPRVHGTTPASARSAS